MASAWVYFHWLLRKLSFPNSPNDLSLQKLTDSRNVGVFAELESFLDQSLGVQITCTCRYMPW